MNSRYVETFAPTQSIEERLQYPFSRPELSFFTNGTEVIDMPNNFTEFCEASNQLLMVNGLAKIEDRIPVIAYGANSNPFELRKKMNAYGEPHLQNELQTVPNILAVIPDTTIVWHGKPSQSGSVFAELYRGEDSLGVESNSHVSFLTKYQVALMQSAIRRRQASN
jgi:hypothetical protein